MYNTSYVQALKSVSSNLKQGAKDAIGSALISANTYCITLQKALKNMLKLM